MITVYHDEEYEPLETIKLTVEPHGTRRYDWRSGGPLDITINIRDEAPGVAEFDALSSIVSEADKLALVVLHRVNGSVGEMSATIKVKDRDSTAVMMSEYEGTPSDYDFESAVVTWADGDDQPKAVAVSLLNNEIYEFPYKTIILYIAQVTHRDMRGTERQEATITILDDGDAGSVGFEEVAHTFIIGKKIEL